MKHKEIERLLRHQTVLMRQPFSRDINELRNERKDRNVERQEKARWKKVGRLRNRISRQSYIDRYKEIQNRSLTASQRRAALLELNKTWELYVTHQELRNYERLARESFVCKRIHRYRAEENVIKRRIDEIKNQPNLSQRIQSIRDFNQELRSSRCMNPATGLYLQIDLGDLISPFRHPGLKGARAVNTSLNASMIQLEHSINAHIDAGGLPPPGLRRY